MRASRTKPDLTVCLIDALHTAHDPLAARDLVFHRAGRAVVKIEMRPAISFRHPDDLFTVVYVVAIPASRVGQTAVRGAITKEGVWFVGDERACLSIRVDLDHAINLVPALIVFERECAAVLAPDRIEDLVRI